MSTEAHGKIPTKGIIGRPYSELLGWMKREIQRFLPLLSLAYTVAFFPNSRILGFT